MHRIISVHKLRVDVCLVKLDNLHRNHLNVLNNLVNKPNYFYHEMENDKPNDIFGFTRLAYHKILCECLHSIVNLLFLV